MRARVRSAWRVEVKIIFESANFRMFASITATGAATPHKAKAVFAHTTRDDRRHLLWRSIAQKWTARRARQSQKRADYAKVVGGLLLKCLLIGPAPDHHTRPQKKCASLFPSVSSFRPILTGAISEGWRCVVDGAVRGKLCCLRPSLNFKRPSFVNSGLPKTFSGLLL